FQSSPMAFVKDWRSPVLLIHGDDDRNVQFGQTVILANALRKQKVDFEELIFPDEIHDFLLYSHWLEAYRDEVRFFARTLRDSPRKPAQEDSADGPNFRQSAPAASLDNGRASTVARKLVREVVSRARWQLWTRRPKNLNSSSSGRSSRAFGCLRHPSSSGRL